MSNKALAVLLVIKFTKRFVGDKEKCSKEDPLPFGFIQVNVY